MKAAAVQMDVKILAREHNLDQILGRLEQAARAGAKLAVFPECALTGYCFVIIRTLENEFSASKWTNPSPPDRRNWAALHWLRSVGCNATKYPS